MGTTKSWQAHARDLHRAESNRRRAWKRKARASRLVMGSLLAVTVLTFVWVIVRLT